MRFAFGGIHIECSTYSRIRTGLDEFRIFSGEAGGRAGVRLSARLPASVFAHLLCPCGSRRRGGTVRLRHVQESVRSILETAVAVGWPLPAMHGALYVDGMQDAEGDWISSARAVVGDECLISASYDLHGNLSRRVIDNLDMLSAYRRRRTSMWRRPCGAPAICW